MIVMIAAAACACLRIAISQGQIELPAAPVRLPFPPSSLLSYVIVPAILWRCLGGNPLACLGPGRWRRLGGVALAAVALPLVGALAAAARAHASTGIRVPFYDLAFIWGTTFCTEFFFRGFLLFPLTEALGWLAAGVQIVPYAIVHAGKPCWELFGSIGFGLWAAWLALRTRSILYGFLVHGALATAGAFAFGY